jgi:predicted nucleic-acid-binding protein
MRGKLKQAGWSDTRRAEILFGEPSYMPIKKYAVALQCTAQSPGYISILVLVELAWVLTTGYGYKKQHIASTIHQILITNEFMVEDRETVWAAMREFESGSSDFADCLISHRNHTQGCTQTFTFDRKAARGSHFTLVD